MNFLKKIGSKSYQKWNFFYELIESNKFSINSYNELIENLKKYKQEIKKDTNIDKDIIQYLYHFMGLYIWTIRDYEEWKYNISWLNNKEDFFDYYEELNNEVILLMNIYED